MKYNLEERTAKFSKRVILLCRQLPRDNITQALALQLVRSATSVGANYREANGASSPKDFRYKIYICKKESRESEYWLGMIGAACLDHQFEANELKEEAHEFILIFQKITSTLNQQSRV